MDDSETHSRQPRTTGFLAISRIDGLGFCGGYLLLNDAGRPIEFHCTLPVRPERAHEILYGATLQPWLFTELISRPLLGKAAACPDVILVEQAELGDVQPYTPAPVVRVWQTEPASEEAGHLRWSPADERHREQVAKTISELTSRVDLLEPFERIRQAIDEAHSTRAAS